MSQRKGFTLIELVVVVMILGILAAVAAPKLLGTSGTATDNGVKQTLAVVRDAIERYAAQNGGALPATPTSLVGSYLRGAFPTCPVGANKNALVEVITGTTAVQAGAAKGWVYNSQTGEFIVNSAASTNDGTTTYNLL